MGFTAVTAAKEFTEETAAEEFAEETEELAADVVLGAAIAEEGAGLLEGKAEDCPAKDDAKFAKLWAPEDAIGGRGTEPFCWEPLEAEDGKEPTGRMLERQFPGTQPVPELNVIWYHAFLLLIM